MPGRQGRTRGGSLQSPGHVTIKVTGDPQLPFVQGSEYRLGELWTRLLDNAIKFGPKGGVIAVRARHSDGDVVVEVEDEGKGVPECDREAVFEPFRQSSDNLVTDKPPGTGVGLSISREIVARHRGTIVLDGAPGGGALLRVTLPTTPSRASVMARLPEGPIAQVEATVGP